MLVVGRLIGASRTVHRRTVLDRERRMLRLHGIPLSPVAILALIATSVLVVRAMTRRSRDDASAVAREIAPDVYCLGPKGRTQTDVYFVRSGSSWVLIDAGWAKDGPAIRQAAEAVFGADSRPAAILLTHDHPDHAGAALELARTWDRPVYVHPDELAQANGDFAAITAAAGPLDTWVVLPLMRAMGRRRREAMLAGSSLKAVVRSYDPAAGVPGLPGWECIHTPGHTPGHVSFFRPTDRVLITGDAVVTMKLNSLSGLVLGRPGLSGPPWYTSWNWRTAKTSVGALARLEPHVLAGGHGTPLVGAETASDLRAFAEHFSGRATTGRSTRIRTAIGHDRWRACSLVGGGTPRRRGERHYTSS